MLRDSALPCPLRALSWSDPTAAGAKGTCSQPAHVLAKSLENRCKDAKDTVEHVECLAGLGASCEAWRDLGACSSSPDTAAACTREADFVQAVRQAGGAGEGLTCFAEGACATKGRETVSHVLGGLGVGSAPGCNCFIRSSHRLPTILVVLAVCILCLGFGFGMRKLACGDVASPSS